MHIVITQTVQILGNTNKVMERRIFRGLEIFIYYQGADSSTYPDAPLPVTRNETRFVTIVNRITFQIIDD